MKRLIRLQAMDMQTSEVKLVRTPAGTLAGEVTFLLGPLPVKVPVDSSDCPALASIGEALEEWALARVPIFEPHGLTSDEVGMHIFPEPKSLVQEEEDEE